VVALAGTIVLDTVKVTPQNAPGMLIAFCGSVDGVAHIDLANFVIVSGNLLWSLVTRNVGRSSKRSSLTLAGQSKKVTTLTLMFAAFAIGNIIGPQVFQAKDAPLYHTAFAVHIALYGMWIW